MRSPRVKPLLNHSDCEGCDSHAQSSDTKTDPPFPGSTKSPVASADSFFLCRLSGGGAGGQICKKRRLWVGRNGLHHGLVVHSCKRRVWGCRSVSLGPPTHRILPCCFEDGAAVPLHVRGRDRGGNSPEQQGGQAHTGLNEGIRGMQSRIGPPSRAAWRQRAGGHADGAPPAAAYAAAVKALLLWGHMPMAVVHTVYAAAGCGCSGQRRGGQASPPAVREASVTQQAHRCAPVDLVQGGDRM